MYPNTSCVSGHPVHSDKEWELALSVLLSLQGFVQNGSQ